MQLVKISRFAWTGAAQNRWMTRFQWWIMLNARKLDCLQSAFSLCSYFNQRDCKLRRYVLGIGTRREKTDCGLQKPSFISGFACSNLSKKIIKRLLAVYTQVRMVRMIDVKQKISKGTAFGWILWQSLWSYTSVPLCVTFDPLVFTDILWNSCFERQ